VSELLEAVIVGGGISGLACAKRLCEAQATFRLITDHLGGRMYHSNDGTMNFGATYINEDYRHLLGYVGRQIPLRVQDAFFQHGDQFTTLFDWRNPRSWPSVCRGVWRLQEFRQALRGFRKQAERVPQHALRPHYPLIDRYSRQPAEEFIAESGLEVLNTRYASLIVRSTAFAAPSEITALFYLGSLLPLIARTWVADFSNTYQQLTARCQERIVLDRVVAVGRRRGHFEVHTQRGTVYPAKNIVIAAPYLDATLLFPVPRPHRVTSATMLFVRGRRRVLYQHKRIVVFAPSPTGIASIWDQGYGWDQVYALCPQPTLSEIYETHTILQAVTWKTAIVLSDAQWAPLELEPGIYLAGDYNVCGLEDSYLTGLCAAHHILCPDIRTVGRGTSFFATVRPPQLSPSQNTSDQYQSDTSRL